MIETALVEAFNLPEDAERRRAAEEIGESGDPDAAAILMAQLGRESSRAVKEAILRGLSEIWSSSPVDSMVELLKDNDPFVRAEAADMLQRRAGDAMDGLTKMMRGEDRDLRKFSVDILSQTAIGVPDLIYKAALEDEDINVVISAVENIGSGRRTALAPDVAAVAMKATQPMAVCACLEALALIGTKESLDLLRPKFPAASGVFGLYLQPFLKFLGGTAGPEAIEEVCLVMEKKGAPIYPVAVDALSKIVARNHVAQLPPYCEGLLCGLLGQQLDGGVRFRLVRVLGRFTREPSVALALLPFLHDPDRSFGLATVESLIHSPLPEVESALAALMAKEQDPEIREELEDLMRRRPRWNSPQNSSPN